MRAPLLARVRISSVIFLSFDISSENQGIYKGDKFFITQFQYALFALVHFLRCQFSQGKVSSYPIVVWCSRHCAAHTSQMHLDCPKANVVSSRIDKADLLHERTCHTSSLIYYTQSYRWKNTLHKKKVQYLDIKCLFRKQDWRWEKVWESGRVHKSGCFERYKVANSEVS